MLKHLRSNSSAKSGAEKIKLFRSVLKDYVSDQPAHAADLLKGTPLMAKSKNKESTDAALKKLFKSDEEKLKMKIWDYVKYFLGLKREVKRK